MIQLFRSKPKKSHARSFILQAKEIPSDSSDEELIPTLPVIINPQTIKQRRHNICCNPILEPMPYTRVVEERPLVYQRVRTSPLIEDRPMAVYRSLESPIRRRRIEVSSSPPATPKKNVHLPKHAKKLVNRFLHNLERAHESMDGNESDCGIDGCEICRRLRSAMDDGARRRIRDDDIYRSSQVVFTKPRSTRKDVHVVETYSSNNQSSDYPVGYTTFVDPNTGLTYIYDPNWQYDVKTQNPIPSENKKHQSADKTVIVHTSRNPTPRTPKVIIEQPRRRHRRSRKHPSTTIITEESTRLPRNKTVTYL